jgi:putative addiction module component (TIGR02574 family)
MRFAFWPRPLRPTRDFERTSTFVPSAPVAMRAKRVRAILYSPSLSEYAGVEWERDHYERIAMSDTLEELERQARSLSAEERARLAEMLLESLQDSPLAEIDAAWDREIEERVAAYDRGELQTHLAEEVFAEARRLAR